ncbi:DedA family protein [Kitasatospora cineracea]|uniref:DedA family protein n=1 Tax=Kitasatospora cineracea TaxID=88074 RepID=UPI0036DA3FB7
MTGPTALLGTLPAGGAYALVSVLVLAESVLVVGPFVPTFTVLLTAGALARTGQLALPPLVPAAAAAAVLGDFAAYRVGRAMGPRLRTCRLARRLPGEAWGRAEALVGRRGGPALLVARFVPVARTLAPYLVGAAGAPYRRTAPFGVAGAGLWAAAETGAGYLAVGFCRSAVLPAAGVVVVAAAVAVRAWWRRRPVDGRARVRRSRTAVANRP